MKILPKLLILSSLGLGGFLITSQLVKADSQAILTNHRSKIASTDFITAQDLTSIDSSKISSKPLITNQSVTHTPLYSTDNSKKAVQVGMPFSDEISPIIVEFSPTQGNPTKPNQAHEYCQYH